MTPYEAFVAAIAREDVGASDFRLALDSFRGSTRALAQELGVTQRTVQRWRAFESGTGGQARSPARSRSAGDLRTLAEGERQRRRLQAVREKRSFSTQSVDVEYMGEPAGARVARTLTAPLNLTRATDLYVSGGSRDAVNDAVSDALMASYGAEALTITDIDGLSLE